MAHQRNYNCPITGACSAGWCSPSPGCEPACTRPPACPPLIRPAWWRRLALAMSPLERDGPAAARLPRLLACLAPGPGPPARLLAPRDVPTRLNPEVTSTVGSL